MNTQHTTTGKQVTDKYSSRDTLETTTLGLYSKLIEKNLKLKRNFYTQAIYIQHLKDENLYKNVVTEYSDDSFLDKNDVIFDSVNIKWIYCKKMNYYYTEVISAYAREDITRYYISLSNAEYRKLLTIFRQRLNDNYKRTDIANSLFYQIDCAMILSVPIVRNKIYKRGK